MVININGFRIEECYSPNKSELVTEKLNKVGAFAVAPAISLEIRTHYLATLRAIGEESNEDSKLEATIHLHCQFDSNLDTLTLNLSRQFPGASYSYKKIFDIVLGSWEVYSVSFSLIAITTLGIPKSTIPSTHIII